MAVAQVFLEEPQGAPGTSEGGKEKKEERKEREEERGEVGREEGRETGGVHTGAEEDSKLLKSTWVTSTAKVPRNTGTLGSGRVQALTAPCCCWPGTHLSVCV